MATAACTGATGEAAGRAEDWAVVAVDSAAAAAASVAAARQTVVR